MANLKEVKNRIVSIQSTQQITSAMKMVAAAKLRKAQDKITKMRPYSERLTGILKNVSAGLDDGGDNVYSTNRDVKKVLLVVVSSDRGLCGSFNSNIFKNTVALIKKKYSDIQSKGGLYILPIGKRSNEYFTKRKYQVISDHYQLFQDLTFENVKVAAESTMDAFVKGDYDQIELIYNEFKNVATQILKNEQFLPIVSSDEGTDDLTSSVDYLFEPSQAYVVNEIIPKSLKIQFYKALLESNASEHGARMTAMDQATDNAGELLKALKLTYNRTRQAAITKEILEIVGGAEALAASS
ncbi:ATP synthase F1 subunit gamma [Reichenbachiella sp. MALMAid0571]|uniref:ATP synthase F1 subunit gamma n=1 Tax=Reichenbachiella sp. MALMAid0571 TaxID=3143939 RepID=UPI0032DEEC39